MEQTTETQVETPATETPTPATETPTPTTETKLYADKFETPEALEDSYKELQSSFSKKLGGFTGAPEEYTASDSPVQGLLEEWGKENNLNQDSFTSLVEGYDKYQEEQHDSQIAQAREELGKDADQRIKNVQDFLFAQLGEELTADFADALNSSAAIKSIEILMNKNNSTKGPAKLETTSKADDINALRFAVDEFGNRKMSIDPEYRKRILELEAQ